MISKPSLTARLPQASGRGRIKCLQDFDRAGDFPKPREPDGDFPRELWEQQSGVERIKFVGSNFPDSLRGEEQLGVRRRFGNRHSVDLVMVGGAGFSFTTLLGFPAAAARTGVIAPGLGDEEKLNYQKPIAHAAQLAFGSS